MMRSRDYPDRPGDESCIASGDCGKSGWDLYVELLNEFEGYAPIILVIDSYDTVTHASLLVRSGGPGLAWVFVADYDVGHSPERYIHGLLHAFALSHCSPAPRGRPHCSVALDLLNGDDVGRLYGEVGDHAFKCLMRHVRWALTHHLGMGANEG
ncbi:hypothetical protein JCM16161A_22200 [Vulcanisaeta sp. JCM 16161]|uniref:hypothetical protein n=1 Tax=Vulcanisaeta sp. JCM 16161 TaxID=1295372 RepID=UPI00406C3B2F